MDVQAIKQDKRYKEVARMAKENGQETIGKLVYVNGCITCGLILDVIVDIETKKPWFKVGYKNVYIYACITDCLIDGVKPRYLPSWIIRHIRIDSG